MKRTLLLGALAASLAGCASDYYGPGPQYGPPPPPRMGAPPPAFDPSGLDWSQQPGSGAIHGQIGYRTSQSGYSCAGASAALTPDAPYSRRRIQRLYGSTERAALPLSVVRGRQATQPSDAYSKFVRVQRCRPDGGFSFEGLPAGGWFVLVAVKPLSGDGETMALMRRVQISPRQVRQVTLP